MARNEVQPIYETNETRKIMDEKDYDENMARILECRRYGNKWRK